MIHDRTATYNIYRKDKFTWKYPANSQITELITGSYTNETYGFFGEGKSTFTNNLLKKKAITAIKHFDKKVSEDFDKIPSSTVQVVNSSVNVVYNPDSPQIGPIGSGWEGFNFKTSVALPDTLGKLFDLGPVQFVFSVFLGSESPMVGFDGKTDTLWELDVDVSQVLQNAVVYVIQTKVTSPYIRIWLFKAIGMLKVPPLGKLAFTVRNRQFGEHNHMKYMKPTETFTTHTSVTMTEISLGVSYKPGKLPGLELARAAGVTNQELDDFEML